MCDTLNLRLHYKNTFYYAHYMSINVQQDALYTVYFICKLLYMFRVVSPPLIRSTNNSIYSVWY